MRQCYSTLSKLKVLLVEDENRLAELLKSAIGDYFSKFEIAYDGISGLKYFRKLKPDIVITDITMPKMTGLELAEKIKKEQPETPIIILSAYSDKEKLLGAIDVGVVKYFIKPFDPEDLLDYLCILADTIKQKNHIKLKAPFTYDLQSKQLFKKGILVHLSNREREFIFQLLNSPNYTLSNDSIKKTLWPEEDASDERLRTFIRRIRQKSDKELIKNVSGQGYVLNMEDE
ncbi:response regulator transcription factor [Hydrogenimonas thermophila]|uniref:DNA-binding response regulator, OmpR family, contains REC and winged-helix (WHTH) domain n=1 Tax=Hydrogenimonas thermophila TaxID=223786 RepID=A0A1I5NFA7_9BACT|nr:response regulator transcription factor [Hydrogenimonas thermophila]WOE69864.1 response regulator transcription factor [Hydrogenimonas thermophila]WOE72379.1 response regulator transcription factor [Hydrogenimonas thermophila]SFP20372.1 DNA-binding response regulator, OmpR family, contains REC and winged-helix (wHTH) domain [Hydrogenimonas thermophila]